MGIADFDGTVVYTWEEYYSSACMFSKHLYESSGRSEIGVFWWSEDAVGYDGESDDDCRVSVQFESVNSLGQAL